MARYPRAVFRLRPSEHLTVLRWLCCQTYSQEGIDKTRGAIRPAAPIVTWRGAIGGYGNCVAVGARIAFVRCLAGSDQRGSRIRGLRRQNRCQCRLQTENRDGAEKGVRDAASQTLWFDVAGCN